MNLFKYDLHVHTLETSPCGKVRASEMVDMYVEAGYSGVVITDHYSKGFFERLVDLEWDEKINEYLKGYYSAYEFARGKKFDVLLGIELTFIDSYNDYLVFGIEEAFLRTNRELYKLGLEKFKQLAEETGLLIFQAHPFRPRMTRPENKLINGIEVYNGNPRHNSDNDIAYCYAVENGLMMVSGSDFHQVCDLAHGGIEVEKRISTSHELVDLIKHGKIKSLIKNV